MNLEAKMRFRNGRFFPKFAGAKILARTMGGGKAPGWAIGEVLENGTVRLHDETGTTLCDEEEFRRTVDLWAVLEGGRTNDEP